MKSSPWIRLLNHLILLLLAIPCLLPLGWMISTSLKTDQQIYPQAGDQAVSIRLADMIPQPARLKNYPEALSFVPFGRYLLNTLTLCFSTVVGVLLSSLVVGYGFSRTRFKGRNFLFFLAQRTFIQGIATTGMKG